jgi:hypothetical protein
VTLTVTDSTYQAAFLTTKDGVVLFDAPPSIGHNLQRAIDEIASANGVRGAMDGRQVGVVGLVAGVGGLAELLGGQGVDQAGLELRGVAGPLDGEVVSPGPLDGDDEVGDTGPGEGLADRPDHGLEARPGMLDDGRGYDDAAVEVGEHPLGAGLGAVDGDDAEVLRPDGLDPGVDRAEGLVDDLGASRLA